jgi:hypothetical protein
MNDRRRDASHRSHQLFQTQRLDQGIKTRPCGRDQTLVLVDLKATKFAQGRRFQVEAACASAALLVRECRSPIGGG